MAFGKIVIILVSLTILKQGVNLRTKKGKLLKILNWTEVANFFTKAKNLAINVISINNREKSSQNNDEWCQDVRVRNIGVHFKLDTGAEIGILPSKNYKLKPNTKLKT